VEENRPGNLAPALKWVLKHWGECTRAAVAFLEEDRKRKYAGCDGKELCEPVLIAISIRCGSEQKINRKIVEIRLKTLNTYIGLEKCGK